MGTVQIVGVLAVVDSRRWLLFFKHRISIGTRPARLELERGIQWLGLDVRAHRVRDDTHAEVEFVARSRLGGGPARRLHERSRFVCEREGGVERWFYVDGTLF